MIETAKFRTMASYNTPSSLMTTYTPHITITTTISTTPDIEPKSEFFLHLFEKLVTKNIPTSTMVTTHTPQISTSPLIPCLICSTILNFSSNI